MCLWLLLRLLLSVIMCLFDAFIVDCTVVKCCGANVSVIVQGGVYRVCFVQLSEYLYCLHHQT